MTNLWKHIAFPVSVSFVLGMVVYSFIQYYHTPLYGDLPQLVLPDPWHQQVLHDPFGFAAFSKHEIYYGPNRFFSVWSLSVYLKSVPLWLQSLISPIDSVYATCAIAKTIMLLLMLWILSTLASGNANRFGKNFFLAAAISIPLFKQSRFSNPIGFIEDPISFCFFYPLPIIFLCLALMPFIRKLLFNDSSRFDLGLKAYIVILVLIISFSGPIVSPSILLICVIAGISMWYNEFQKLKSENFFSRWFRAVFHIPHFYLFILAFSFVVNLYSLYIGTFNSENFSSAISVGERYSRIPEGLVNILTVNTGLSSLLLIVLLNLVLLSRLPKTEERNSIIRFAKYMGIFSLLYILLLPLGGYREYRPFIIRSDTLLPVITVIMIFYGRTSFFLLKTVSVKTSYWYIPLLVVFILQLMVLNKPYSSDNNDCERNAFTKIANSKDSVVVVSADCPIIDWSITTEASTSLYKAQLLHSWKITDKVKLFYQK